MNKITVVILNFNRPNYIKKNIIPFLKDISEVDEVIISHGKKETSFNVEDEDGFTIKNLEHWGDLNKNYGLSLRFLSSLESKNNKILIMDDDIIPNKNTISFLDEKITEDENRIYGLYGRSIDEKNTYSVTNYFGEVPIVLTRCLITTKEMCQYFMDNFRIYENEMIKDSNPYWNGEDILFSLLSIKKYGKLPKAYDLKHNNRVMNYLNLKDSISLGNNNHLEYRKKLTIYLINKLELDKKIKSEKKIKTWRSQFTYFFTNSILLFIFYIFVIFTFIFDIYWYIIRV